MRFVLRFFGFLFSVGAIFFLIGAAGLAYGYWMFSKDLPDHAQLADYEPPVMTRVHASDGSLIAEYARERRLHMPIQAMPKLVIEAFLSAEDKNFYRHAGIDPEGIVRAIVANLALGGRREQGASTITQQVAKNFLLVERADLRAQDPRGAARAADRVDLLQGPHPRALSERDLSRPQQLRRRRRGAQLFRQVGARTDHRRGRLSGGPARRRRTTTIRIRQKQAAIERRNWVIDRMVDNGYIKNEEADAAKKEPLTVSPRLVSPNSIASGYFAEGVRRDIADRYGEETLYEGGLLIRSTLDPQMQAMARKALVDGLVRFDEARGWRGAQQKIELDRTRMGSGPGRSAGAGRRAALAPGRRAGGRRRTGPDRSAAEEGSLRSDRHGPRDRHS